MVPKSEADFFRRPPRQARSRELVARILSATQRLLEQDGLQRLTTNHIAREAEIDIASLYQYFGSKEAVLYTLLENRMHLVQAVYAQHRSVPGDAQLPMLESLRRIYRDLKRIPAQDWHWRHLAPLVEVFPVLRRLQAEHEQITTEFWAGWLRTHGVNWEEARLSALGHLLYVQVDAAMRLAGRVPAEQAHWVRHWQRRQSIALLRYCFPRRRG